MNRLIALWLLIVLSACSTVERYSYYSPQSTAGTVTGPKKPFCGWTNFGGQPDTFLYQTESKDLSLQAYQRMDVYLFGPWFASVLPVFPISWIVNLFSSDNLIVSFNSRSPVFAGLKNEDITLSYSQPNGSIKVLHPSDIQIEFRKVIFPVSASNIRSFTLHIEKKDEPDRAIEISFSKTARWAWTQWTPNC